MRKYRPTPTIAFFTVLALFFLLAPTTLAANGTFQSARPPSVSATEGIARDAQTYATHYGIDVQEAQRRLERQDTIGALNAALQNGEKATFAGLRIEHRPAYRIVAQFTQGGEQTIQRYTAGGPLDGLIETEVARLTLAQLEAAQVAALRILRPLGIPLDAGLNVAENRAEIYVVERVRLDAALRVSAIALPDGVAITTVAGLAQPAVDVYAGLANDDCTLGFSVSGPEGTGTTTAAHCNNPQSTGGANLPFIFEWNGWDRDVQWHTAPGQTVKSLTEDGAGGRNVASTRGRDNQTIGEVACHFGRTTGYGCGEIADKNRTGSGGYDSPTYIRVANYGSNLSLGGDSGGPWFTGGTALGTMQSTVQGDNGIQDGVYMGINYIESTGLVVRLNCPGGC